MIPCPLQRMIHPHRSYIFGHMAQLQHSGFSAVGAELLFPQIFFKTQAAHALED